MASPAAFPDTHWSRLADLRTRPQAEREETLRWFARHYWTPVREYLRVLRRGEPQDIDDLTQHFFATLLERDDLSTLSPDRGSVRGFLKTALRNFVANVSRSERVRPRGVPLEAADAVAIARAPSPEQAFDKAWIERVLAEGLARLRAQLEQEGRAAQFALFDEYCLHDERPVTYEELGSQHGLKAEDVRNRVRDTRRRLERIVRALVAEYTGDAQSVDEEIAFILGG